MSTELICNYNAQVLAGLPPEENVVPGEFRQHSARCPRWLTASLAALPSMSLLPVSILRKHGYPPDLEAEATKAVLAQAELLCAEWAA